MAFIVGVPNPRPEQTFELEQEALDPIGARLIPFQAREPGEYLDALADADAVLGGLTAERLLEARTIQGRDVTVLEAVYHVVEHFSMHTGQIILLTKLHAPGAVRFYEDAGGLARPIWR